MYASNIQYAAMHILSIRGSGRVAARARQSVTARAWVQGDLRVGSGGRAKGRQLLAECGMVQRGTRYKT